MINAQDLEKTLRIVITSGMVNHERFVGALKESLVPACKKVWHCCKILQANHEITFTLLKCIKVGKLMVGVFDLAMQSEIWILPNIFPKIC